MGRWLGEYSYLQNVGSRAFALRPGCESSRISFLGLHCNRRALKAMPPALNMSPSMLFMLGTFVQVALVAVQGCEDDPDIDLCDGLWLPQIADTSDNITAAQWKNGIELASYNGMFTQKATKDFLLVAKNIDVVANKADMYVNIEKFDKQLKYLIKGKSDGSMAPVPTQRIMDQLYDVQVKWVSLRKLLEDSIDVVRFADGSTNTTLLKRLYDENLPTTGTMTVTVPSNGTVTVNNGGTPNNPSDDVVTYTPNTSFSGTDTFEYTVCNTASPAICSTSTVSPLYKPLNR